MGRLSVPLALAANVTFYAGPYTLSSILGMRAWMRAKPRQNATVYTAFAGMCIGLAMMLSQTMEVYQIYRGYL
jgi:hypothetical protein